jgi:hypothetical protein
MLGTATPSRRPPPAPSLAVTQGARLLRLGRAGAVWVLELEALVPVRERILRPMRHTVEGSSAVLAWFQARPDLRALAAEAQAMIQRNDAMEESPLGLEPRDGAWAKVLPRPGVEPLRARGDNAGAARDRLLMVGEGDGIGQRDLAVLRVTLDRLMRRLGTIEQRLEHSAKSDDVAKQMAALAEAQERIAARVAKLESSFESGVRVAAPEPAKDPHAHAAKEHDTAKEHGARALRLPQTRDISLCMKKLIGERYAVHDWRKDPTDLSAVSSPWYISTLVDDHGAVVGAMLGDLLSTVNLGGGLMMLPSGELKDQLTAMEANEETAAAYSEVFNTLSSLVNAIPNNSHVRTTYLEPLDLAKHPWLHDPAFRMEMEDSTGGRMVFLSRRP